MESEKLLELFGKSEGILKYSELYSAGLSQREIKKMRDTGVIEKVAHGLYTHKDYLQDNMMNYQYVNKNIIFSNETAAYMHNLTDRFPRINSLTTISGVNLRKRKEFKVYYVKKELFLLGAIEMKNNAGNIVRVYDKERTVCDIIKNQSRIEQQIYIEVINNYFKGDSNLVKLSRYAKKLGISKKVYELSVLLQDS